MSQADPSQHRPTSAEIDLGAIAANFRTLRALVEDGAFFCPMVKADAYGHGDCEVARALRRAGATHLGVCTIEEGEALRAAGDQLSVLVFGPYHEAASAQALLEWRLTPVVTSWDQLTLLTQAADKRGEAALRVHLKFNTGMNRLGFKVDDAPRLRAWLDAHERFRLEGICTHLLRGDDAGDDESETALQFAAFQRALAAFRGLRFQAHALNSAGLAAFAHREEARALYDRATFGPLGARPGIAIYGAQGSERATLQLKLQPALSLKSQVVAVTRLKAGEGVSYGARWRAARESWIGVVPIGYGDGYLRSLSNCGTVLCRGHRVPVVGTVCMDYLMIDMTEIAAPGESVTHGDEVVLIGAQAPARHHHSSERVTADELAARAGTISYELFTRLGKRVPKRYIERYSEGDPP